MPTKWFRFTKDGVTQTTAISWPNGVDVDAKTRTQLERFKARGCTSVSVVSEPTATRGASGIPGLSAAEERRYKELKAKVKAAADRGTALAPGVSIPGLDASQAAEYSKLKAQIARAADRMANK